MKESTKEWLGLKPADIVLYIGFALLLPVYFSSSQPIDIALSAIGFVLCLVSCWLGMKPHPELDKATNSTKLVAYPACSLFYLYVVYLSFTSW